MLSIVTQAAQIGLGPFTYTYLASLCAVVTVGGTYLAAVWVSRRVRPYLDDLEDNAAVDERHRKAAAMGGFTPPTAPAEPSTAKFDAAVVVPIGAQLRQVSTLEYSADGGKTWQSAADACSTGEG